MPSSRDDTPSEDKPRPFGWTSILILVVLAVVSWFVLKKMVEIARVQDCVMSGRRNCAPLEDPAPR